MRHSAADKLHALAFREKGYTFNEIAALIQIPSGTVRYWTHSVLLDMPAQERIAQRIENGRLKGYEILRKERQRIKENLYRRVKDELSSIDLKPNLQKLLCSLLYWAEGSKRTDKVGFTNSDPQMISVFLELFRGSFFVDERKMRCLVHLHSYHNENKVKAFWSGVTGIPLTQFTKSYQKQNSGKQKKPGYMGTLNFDYYDAKIAQELSATYNTLKFLLNRGVG